MTDEQILKLAKKVGFSFDEDDETWFCLDEELLKFARAIIEEHEKDREHNLGKDEYFNSWRE